MSLITLGRALRVSHWIKNLVIFGPLLFDRKLLDPVYFNQTLVAFAIFCILSSSIYLLNDVADKTHDLHHPSKRLRPVASGQISTRSALSIAFIFALIMLPMGFIFHTWLGLLATVYWLQNVAYSYRLKHVVILDIFIIASGFVLRVAAGAVMVKLEQGPLGSPWIYVCVALGALFISLGKRRHEFTVNDGAQSAHRPVLADYSLPLIDAMLLAVSTSTIVSYSLYTFSAPNLPDSNIMMVTIPIVVYAIFRYLYLIYIQGKGDSPHSLFFQDRPLLTALAIWLATTSVILYIA